MAVRTRKARTGRNIHRTENLFGWLFVAPLMTQLLVFLLIPLAASFVISFSQWNLISPPILVGLRNYLQLFRNEYFIKAIGNTFFLMIGIPIGMVCSFLVAVMVKHRMGSLSDLFKVLLYLPAVTNGVAVAITWKWIFNADFGLLNSFLGWFGISEGPRWLTDPLWIKPAFILMGIWGGLGGSMLLFFAALSNIPEEMYEAAEIDGASFFQKMIRISVPLSTPTIFFILVVGVIGGLQSFGQTYIMAPGGGVEYSAGTLVYFIWQQGMEQMKMGYATATAWMLGLFILVVTILQFRFQKHWVRDAS